MNQVPDMKFFWEHFAFIRFYFPLNSVQIFDDLTFCGWLLLQGKYFFSNQNRLLANQKAYHLLKHGCEGEKSLGFCFQRYENK